MEKNEVLYLKYKDYHTFAYYDNYEEEIISLYSFINQACKEYLLDIGTYRRNVNKILNIKSKTPFYFSERFLLFYVKEDSNAYYINYKKLIHISYEDNNAYFIFENGFILKIAISKYVLESITAKINTLIEYKLNKW